MDPATAAALAAGASTVATGLLGKGEKKEWDFREREKLENERFKWLRKGARKAGFNPLTVLGATGGQMGAGPTVTSSPLGLGAILGAAAADAGAAYLNYDPVADETAQARLDNIRADTTLREAEALRFGQTPVTTDPAKRSVNVVDLGSPRPEDHRIQEGPYKGRYLWATTDQTEFGNNAVVMLPADWTPGEAREAIAGGAAGEAMSAVDFILQEGGTPVEYDWNSKTFTVPPRSKRPTQRPPIMAGPDGRDFIIDPNTGEKVYRDPNGGFGVFIAN